MANTESHHDPIDYAPALASIVSRAIPKFHGQLTELESAIGALFVGQNFGWKPLLLVHDKKTLRKYETILGIEFKDHMPEVGPHADKSRAWLAVQKISNFWKAVKGEIKGVRTPEID